MIIIPVMAVLLVQSSIAKGRLPLGFFIGLSTEDPYSPNTSPAALYAASAGRLECLARLADIRIDGAALGLRLDATSDPETGQPGMLAMLPVSALAPGRHEVSLNAPTRDDGNAQAPRRYRIPFWK